MRGEEAEESCGCEEGLHRENEVLFNELLGLYVHIVIFCVGETFLAQDLLLLQDAL